MDYYQYADVMELVDMLDLGSSAARCAGSIPVIRTKASQKLRGFFYGQNLHYTVLAKPRSSRHKSK